MRPRSSKPTYVAPQFVQSTHRAAQCPILKKTLHRITAATATGTAVPVTLLLRIVGALLCLGFTNLRLRVYDQRIGAVVSRVSTCVSWPPTPRSLRPLLIR